MKVLALLLSMTFVSATIKYGACHYFDRIRDNFVILPVKVTWSKAPTCTKFWAVPSLGSVCEDGDIAWACKNWFSACREGNCKAYSCFSVNDAKQHTNRMCPGLRY